MVPGYVQPSGNIKLYRGVPLSPDHADVLYITSEEQALNYLKNNFPSYTNFRIFGTGEWDDPYAATMEKTLKIYDVRSKQNYNMVVDDEK